MAGTDAPLQAATAGKLEVRIASTRSATSSLTRDGKREISPFAARRSNRMVVPSIQPRRLSTSITGPDVGESSVAGEPAERYPTRLIFPCANYLCSTNVSNCVSLRNQNPRPDCLHPDTAIEVCARAASIEGAREGHFKAADQRGSRHHHFSRPKNDRLVLKCTIR